MSPDKRIDMHMHVGLLGNQWPQWGKLSDWYRRQLVYKIFLLYARIKEDQVSDRVLKEKALATIEASGLDQVVCLALDPVYDAKGVRRPELSHLWVDNDYIVELRKELPQKILLGASVHPYDPSFKERVKKYVGEGAVLLKWLPSAQQIDLADPRVKDALLFLAQARDGKPLPLLLHCGVEYAIPTSDFRTTSYDFLTWGWWDGFWNFWRFGKKWHRPKVKEIRANLEAALDAGAVIIFAHCGLPYFAPNFLKEFAEHSDFDEVRRYLEGNLKALSGKKRRAYADVSAFCTPFRRDYFKDVAKLPPEYLLFGSDFPTPAFELSADLGEMWEDFKAVMQGHLERIVIPEDNLLDVNYRELQAAFPGHPMFKNFNVLLPAAS
ncbi:MAG: hypothetical protein L0196_04070 [candidate division Zixibacteria bacterium]|nr:hypothetical protein [candidate division Zixibacteria bacterium]